MPSAKLSRIERSAANEAANITPMMKNNTTLIATIPIKAGGKGDRRMRAAENRLPAPVIGTTSAGTILMRLMRGAVRNANSRHSADSAVSAEIASRKLAQVPTQTTPQSTWTHNTTDLITIACSRSPCSSPSRSPIESSMRRLDRFCKDRTSQRSFSEGGGGASVVRTVRLNPRGSEVCGSGTGLEHHIEHRRGRAPNTGEAARADHLAQLLLARLGAERRLTLLRQGCRGADHGGGGVTEAADRMHILGDGVACHRFHDHPGAVGRETLAHVSRRAGGIAHVVQAIEKRDEVVSTRVVLGHSALEPRVGADAG